MAEPVTLIVSVDTEEDNWEPAATGLTVENIRELPRLGLFLERFGVRPTYFTTYQVASTGWAAEIVCGIAGTSQGEVGAHLHPWNTPPIAFEMTPAVTMVGNLPMAVQRAKIQVLTVMLQTAMGKRPSSFRAGRWGLNASTASALIECGYRADSSVTPFRSWSEDFGPSHVGAPLGVYRLGLQSDHRLHTRNGPLVEVPVSSGYSRRGWRVAQAINRALDAGVLQRTGILVLAERLHLFNHVVLSPEIEAVPHMVTLVRRLLARGVRHLNLTFHSSSLRAGLNPFSRTEADVDRFYTRLATMIEKIGDMTDLRFATVREAASLLAPPIEPSTADTTGARVSSEKRLLVVSYHFPPDPAIGSMRWAGLTKYLAAHGWSSWVVTAAVQQEPALPGVTVLTHRRRTTLNDLYLRWRSRVRRNAPRREPDTGMAAPKAPARGSWFAQFRYEAGVLLGLPDDARGWVLTAAWATRRLIARENPSVVVSSGPPHSAHLATWLATRFMRVSWMVDLRDPWAGPITDGWAETTFVRSKLAHWLTTRLEGLVLRSATTIICNTREFTVALATRYPNARIAFVPNAVDRALLPAITAPPFAGLGIVHVGTIYGGRDLGPVLLALREFLRRHPEAATDGTRVRLAGSLEAPFASAVHREVSELQLDQVVDFLGVLPRHEALELVGRSRLAVVLAQDQEFQVPAKLYEMVAMGVPTVVIASPESAASSEAERLGASAISPKDIAGLVHLMEEVWSPSVQSARTPASDVDYEQLARRVSMFLAAPETVTPVLPGPVPAPAQEII
ncbi:MAG TPA: glycosyltransferase [Gemmatimonadaceae bacterium]|nr:glycosyltransferase [Gemmatimonadaceae bacterium]